MKRRSFLLSLAASVASFAVPVHVAWGIFKPRGRRLIVRDGERVFLEGNYESVIVENGGSIIGCNDGVIDTLTICDGGSFYAESVTANSLSIAEYTVTVAAMDALR